MSLSWLSNVAALFTDYDGTIAPIDVARELSKPPKEIYEILNKISKLIPVAVVSTKDCDFLITRTDFATAWACTYGLEIRISGNTIVNEELIKWQDKISELINYVKGIIPNGVYLEIKHVGNLIGGIGIDWRKVKNMDKAIISRIIEHARDMEFKVIEYSNHPFIDIYPGIQVSKGDAVAKLRRLLNIRGPIMYLGDSENDIEAMKLVEYPVGIRHRYNTGLNLPVKLWIEEWELPSFLKKLYDQLNSKTNID